MDKLTKNPVALGVAGLAGVGVLLLLLRGRGDSSSNYAVLLPSPVAGGGSGSFEPGPTTPPASTTPKPTPTTPKPELPREPDAFRDPLPLPNPIPPKLREALDRFRKPFGGGSEIPAPTKPVSPKPLPTLPVLPPLKEFAAPLSVLPAALASVLGAADDLTEGLPHIVPLDPGQGLQLDTSGGFDDDLVQAIKTQVVTPFTAGVANVTPPPIQNITQPIKDAVVSVKGGIKDAAVNFR